MRHSEPKTIVPLKSILYQFYLAEEACLKFCGCNKCAVRTLDAYLFEDAGATFKKEED